MPNPNSFPTTPDRYNGLRGRVLEVASDPELRARVLDGARKYGAPVLRAAAQEANLIKERDGQTRVKKTGVLRAALNPANTARKLVQGAVKQGRSDVRAAALEGGMRAISNVRKDGYGEPMPPSTFSEPASSETAPPSMFSATEHGRPSSVEAPPSTFSASEHGPPRPRNLETPPPSMFDTPETTPPPSNF